MIDIRIKTDGEQIFDQFNNKECTLTETAAVLYRLEQIKLLLIAKEFESDIEIGEDLDETN